MASSVPVHLSSIPACRLSGTPKTYPPSKGCSKHASVTRRSQCSILKKDPRIGGTLRKRVRFSLPGEGNGADSDSSLYFKGFTSADVSRLDKLRNSMKQFQETLTLRQKIAVAETIHRKNGAIPLKVGKQKTPKKRVRFSLPGDDDGADDDSSLSFKGFTSADKIRLDKLCNSIKILQKTLTLRQKIAVVETIRRKNGEIPFKVGKRKGYLCQKKFERDISKTGHMVKTGNVSEVDVNVFPHKPESRKMQCRICNLIAYLPVTQQQTEVGTSVYFCCDCFEKSAPMCTTSHSAPQRNAPKTGVALRTPPTVTAAAADDRDLDFVEESHIVISSVCSLASTIVSDGLKLNELEKPVDKFFDDNAEGTLLFLPVNIEELKPELFTHPDPEWYEHQVNNEVKQTKKKEGKTVTIRTTEGLFTVLIQEGDVHDSVTPLFYEKQAGATDEDPICID